MECEGSLLHSQQHATCPYSKHNILPPHHSLCPLPILVWVSSVTSFLDVLWPNILYVSNLHCALCSTHFVSLHLTRCTATTCSSLNLRFTPNLNDIYSYMFLQHTFYSLHKHTHTHTHRQFECSPCSLADADCDFQSCWARCQAAHHTYFRRAFCDGPSWNVVDVLVFKHANMFSVIHCHQIPYLSLQINLQ